MEEKEFIELLDGAYSNGKTLDEVIKKLKRTGFDQSYIDIASKHYASKKKSKDRASKRIGVTIHFWRRDYFFGFEAS